MNVKPIVESGLFERTWILSGRIYREGSAPEYGVIFTTTESRSEDDLGLNPEQLLGALIGHKEDNESNRDAFFKILGGYFYHDNYPESPKTTKVFGNVLEPEFGMTEGGSTTINAKWKLDDPERPILDESHWSKQDSKYNGWTFIVELKEKEKYPHSYEELKIFVACPEIKDIKVTIGECKTEGEIRRRLVTFTASIEGDEPDSWIWHFGDGSTESGKGKPPNAVNHFYEKRPQSIPKLCVMGPEPCNESCKEVDLSEFEECPPCPQITQIEHVVSDKDDTTKSIKFTAVTKNGTPEEFNWDWGNDSLPETTSEATAFHDFKIPASGIAKYTVKVSSTGPGDCQDSCKKTIEIPAKDIPVKPKYCILLPLIVAFLMAVTFGTFITYSVANTIEQALNYDWLAPIIVVLSILTLIAIIFWYQYGKKIPCPTPSKCDWLGIGWAVMFAGMLVAFFVKDCCAAWWWIIIIVLLGLAALPFYFWYKKCEITVKTIIFHLIACLLAVGCVCYLCAYNLSVHCLS